MNIKKIKKDIKSRSEDYMEWYEKFHKKEKWVKIDSILGSDPNLIVGGFLYDTLSGK